jgi:uncharacterized protein YjeT (DUF2065 family)
MRVRPLNSMPAYHPVACSSGNQRPGNNLARVAITEELMPRHRPRDAKRVARNMRKTPGKMRRLIIAMIRLRMGFEEDASTDLDDPISGFPCPHGRSGLWKRLGDTRSKWKSKRRTKSERTELQ